MKAVHKMIDKLLDETPDMEVEELVKKLKADVSEAQQSLDKYIFNLFCFMPLH